MIEEDGSREDQSSTKAGRRPRDLRRHDKLPYDRIGSGRGRHAEGRAAAGRIFLSIRVIKFKVLDCLITNFHLPESTLVMLVSALAGREHMLAAYEEAVKERYRFFSALGMRCL